ncbi:unnamed protein product, partial [Polarella glacialis]
MLPQKLHASIGARSSQVWVLPAAVYRIKSVRAFSSDADRLVGFGKHRSLTYQQLTTRHPDYCDWLCTVHSTKLEVQRMQLFVERCCNQHVVFKQEALDADCKVGFGKHHDLTYTQALKHHADYCQWILRAEAATWQLRKLLNDGGRPSALAMNEVADASLEAMGRFSCNELSMLATVCSAVFQDHDVLWFKLASAAARWQSDSFSAEHVANFAVSIAKAGRHDVSFLVDLSDAVLRIIPDLTPRHLASIAWAFAKIGRDDPRLFDALAAAALPVIRDFSPHGLSNFVWAYARFGKDCSEVFEAAGVVSLERIADFSRLDLATTAWAFAKLGKKAPQLFDAVAVAAMTRIREFRTKELAAIVWAFAKLSRNVPGLFDAVAEAAPQTMGKFLPKGLSQIAWAFATIGRNDPKLFDTLSKEALVQIGEFAPQGLSNMVWAHATIGRNDPRLFDAVAAVSLTRVREFSEQNIANMVWAYAKARRNDALLFDALADDALTKIDAFLPQGLSSMVWAYAVMRRHEPKLFDAVAVASLARIGKFDCQNLANTAWAFDEADLASTVMGERLFNAIVEKALTEKWIGLDATHGSQSFDTIEARCAELLGRELDIVLQAADGTLVNIEIDELLDELYHRTPRQRKIDYRREAEKVYSRRRDTLLQRLGVHVVRFDAFDEFGREREDLAEAAKTDAGEFTVRVSARPRKLEAMFCKALKPELLSPARYTHTLSVSPDCGEAGGSPASLSEQELRFSLIPRAMLDPTAYSEARRAEDSARAYWRCAEVALRWPQRFQGVEAVALWSDGSGEDTSGPWLLRWADEFLPVGAPAAELRPKDAKEGSSGWGSSFVAGGELEVRPLRGSWHATLAL